MERIYSQRLSNRFGSGNLLPNITASLGYQQADIRGKRRMESLFNMGLPLQSDINKVRLEGVDKNRMGIYSAAPHQPWGDWGALSGPTAEDGTPVTTGKFDTSKSSTPSTSERGAPIGTKEKAIMRERAASDPRRQFGWTGSSPFASNEERDARQALDVSRPMGRGRTRGPVAPSPEPLPMSMPPVPIFPYLRPKPAYDLGESRGYGSFSNYLPYGPTSL